VENDGFILSYNQNQIIMNKHYLQSQLKDSGKAYLFYFLGGSHYAYMGNWGIQILFWITFGGMFFWAFIDMFRISSIVQKHNMPILQKIADLEKREKDEDFQKQMMMMQAVKNG